MARQHFLESDAGGASLDVLVEELESGTMSYSLWSRVNAAGGHMMMPVVSTAMMGLGAGISGDVEYVSAVWNTAITLSPWYVMKLAQGISSFLNPGAEQAVFARDLPMRIKYLEGWGNRFSEMAMRGLMHSLGFMFLGGVASCVTGMSAPLRILFHLGWLNGMGEGLNRIISVCTLAGDVEDVPRRRKADVDRLVRLLRPEDIERLDTYASVHGPEVNACAAQLNEKGRLVGKLYVNEDDESTMWRMKRSSGGNTVQHLSHVVSALHELTREECTLGITASLDQASYENLCDAVFDHVTEVAVEGVRDDDVLFTVKYVRHKVGGSAEVRVYDADMMRVVPVVYKAIFDHDAQVRDVPSSLWWQAASTGERVLEEMAEIEELQEESEEPDADEEEIAEFKDLCGLPEPATFSDRVIALFEKFRDKINWDDEMPSITILSGSVAYVLRPGKERRGILLHGSYERMYDVILAAQVEGIDGSSVFELAKELHDEGKGVMPGVVVDVLLEAVDYHGFFTLRQRPQSIAEHCFFAELRDKTNCEVEISLPDEGVSYANLLSCGNIASTPIETPDFSGHVILGEAYAEKVLEASNVRVMANTNKWVLLREGLVRVDTVFSAVKTVADVSSGSASIRLE